MQIAGDGGSAAGATDDDRDSAYGSFGRGLSHDDDRRRSGKANCGAGAHRRRPIDAAARRATNVTGRTAAERPSAPGGETDDRRRHRGASRGEGATREDTRAVAPSRGSVWPW